MYDTTKSLIYKDKNYGSKLKTTGLGYNMENIWHYTKKLFFEKLKNFIKQ